MKLNSVKIGNILRRAVRGTTLLGCLLTAMCLSSCESLHDDMSDCRSGIRLAFNYDYHMEPGANAFTSNVDCVTVYVFDKSGNYLTHFTETSDVLRNANYRMELPLEAGDYHLVVYGGTACEKATVKFSPNWGPSSRGHKDDILVTVPTDEKGESSALLHKIEQPSPGVYAPSGGLFYGTLNVTVTEQDYRKGNFRQVTVDLMKDTNSILVILQELNNPDKMDYKDYTFKIVDDNFTLNGYNDPVHADDSRAGEEVLKYYAPHNCENRITGYIENDGREGTQATEDANRLVRVACAEFSTSRLVCGNVDKARLIVNSTLEKDDDGNDKEIINIPLITYLAKTQGFGDSWIKDEQEFLDRQSRWELVFFLQRNVWLSTRVVVNSWIVRENNIDLSY